MQESSLATSLLMLISAAGYVAATYFMKLWGRTEALWVIGLIIVALALATVAEIILLKHARVGSTYLMIIAIECLMVAFVAMVLMRESYSLSELAGLVLIVSGVALFQFSEHIKAGESTVADETTNHAVGASTSSAKLLQPVRANKRDRIAMRR